MDENEEVKKLAALLLKNPADKRDELVVKAKIQVSEKEELGQIFDNQIRDLQREQYPQPIIEKLSCQRDEAVEKAYQIWKKEYPGKTIEEVREMNIIPLLLVIPRDYIGIQFQLELMDKRCAVRQSWIANNKASEKVSWRPYAIYFVENGKGRSSKERKDVEKETSERKRRFLTVEEVIASVRHTLCLGFYGGAEYILALDSCNQQETQNVIALSLMDDTLKSDYPYDVYKRYFDFIPSCDCDSQID